MSAWEITRKDLTLLFRDKRALITLIALPILLIAVVGMSTGKLFAWKTRSDNYTLAFFDGAGTEAAIRLQEKISRLDGVKLARFDSEKAALRDMESKKSDAALLIGSGFAERTKELKLRDIFRIDDGALQDGLASLDIRFKGGDHNEVSPLISRVLFSAAVSSVLPDVAQKYPLTRRLVQDDPEQTDRAEPAVAATAETNASSGESRIYEFAVPTYTVLFVFFLITVMGRSFLQERELGTLRRLRLAPISDASIIVGKTVPFLIISVLQTGALFLAGRLMFGMSWGQQPVLILPVLFCTSLAATSLGLLFATIVRSDNQVSAYGNLIVLGAASISGCLTPRSWLPEMMQKISLITPHAWALDGYRELLRGDGVVDVRVVAGCCAMLTLFATAFFSVGLVRFRRLREAY